MPFMKKEDSVQNPLLEAINEIKRSSDSIFKSDEPEIIDVMTFCNSPEYLNLPGSNFNLFLSQRVILKCFYMNTRGNEGIKLNKEEWEWLYEHEVAEERDGLTFEKNGRAVIDKLQKMEKAEGDDKFTFRELCLVLGRRGSKTILASVITAYEIYKLLVIGDGDPHKFYGLPYDDEIAIINVALSQEQSGRLFGQIQARIRNSPFFKGRIAKETTKEIRFYTDKDLEKKTKGTILSVPGSILMLCGHSNPDTLRGYSTILILFDELAFYDDVGKVTGQAFYNALKPSLAKFKEFGDGRLVEISSPNNMSGIFYNIFLDSRKEDNILALQLPTWCSNPDISYEGLRVDRQRNPEMFSIEYGAQWAKTSAMGPFFPEGLIERCMRLDLEPHNKPMPGFNYHIHVDPANGGDRYVLVLVGKKYYKNLRGQKRNMVYLANVKIYEPVPGVGLQFNTIDKDVLRICSIFHPMTVSYDSWNSIQSLQMLRSHGVRCIPTTYNRNYKLKIYQNLLDMMSYAEGPELLLYDDPLLILEMKALRKKQIQRGMSIVKDKNGIVKTDDIIDCLAGAVSMASGHVRASLPEPVCVDMGFR